MKSIDAYDGFIFASLSSYLAGEMPVDGNVNPWQTNFRVTTRGADSPIIGLGESTPRTITVDFVINDNAVTDMLQFFDMLTGRLNPFDQSPRRKLWATRTDGTAVWRYALISKPPTWTATGEFNVVTVEFISADPRWFKTTKRTITALDDSTPGGAQAWGNNQPGIALPNAGQAVVHPTIKIKRALSGNSADSGPWSLGGAVSAWAYRRQLPYTNNLTRTISNMPVCYMIGNTATLVSGSKARSDGADFRVIHPNGKNVQRDLVGWNTEMTWVYFVIDKLAPGETITYDLVYGNPQATTFSPLQYPTKPAFLYDSYVSVANFAAVDASKLWVEITGDVLSIDNKWQDGAIYFRTGANAGTGAQIASHTYNTPTAGRTRITFTSAMANTLATTDRIAILGSRQGTWLWQTQNDKVRPTDYARGRWYANSGANSPSVIDYFDVPASWAPALYYDGTDKKGQPRFSRIVTGSPYTYTDLDAQRTWDGGPTIKEEGTADGVSITMPFPISAYRWAGTLLNPNSMAKMFIGARGSGGNDWREIDSSTAASTTLTAASSVTVISGSDTLQLYHGLIPGYGDEISRDWQKDNGTATADTTTTTLTDGSKSWETNKWVGGTLRFTSGKKAGTTRTVTANTASTITFTGSVATVKADQKYELNNGPLVAQVRDGNRCTVQFDDSGLVQGPLGSEESVHDIGVAMWIGGGKDAKPLTGERRNRVLVGRTAELVLLRSGQNENLVIDSANRIAYEENYLTSGVNRYYADPLVQWQTFDDLGVQRISQNGLPLPIGQNETNNPNFGADISNWTYTTTNSAGVTATRDTTLYVSSPSSLRMALSANPSPPATVTAINDARRPAQEGQLVAVSAWLRTTNVAAPSLFQPLVGLAFYDVSNTLISYSFQSAGTDGQPTQKWVPEAHAAQCPAGTVTYGPVIRLFLDIGTTGYVGNWINVDNVDVGSPVLFFTFYKAMGGVEVSYNEAFNL